MSFIGLLSWAKRFLLPIALVRGQVPVSVSPVALQYFNLSEFERGLRPAREVGLARLPRAVE